MSKKGLLSLALLMALCMSILPRSAGLVGAATGAIFTSQLGFAPGDPKIAVLAVPTGAAVEQSFRVLEAGTLELAYPVADTGDTVTMTYHPNGWNGNNTTGDTYLLDFSGFTPTTSGTYVVEGTAAGSKVQSLPFEIGADVYDMQRVRDAQGKLRTPVDFFAIQRSGVSKTIEALDGWKQTHKPNHLDDARQATRKDKGGGDGSLIEQDYVSLPDAHLDATGGWFDAGDYNEYMGNTPWAAYLLLLTYEEFGDYWGRVDNDGNGQSDLLDQLRPALDWMLKMQVTSGSDQGAVYERVFNEYAAPFDGCPEEETNNAADGDDRPLDTDRYADITAKLTYAMATAQRVFGDAEYLERAKAAWDWAYAHPSQVKPKRYGSGLYFGDLEIGLTLGALEIYRAEKLAGTDPDPKYLSYATGQVRKHLERQDWVNPSSWDYQQSYVLTRYYDIVSEFVANDPAVGQDKLTILDQLKGRWDAGIRSQSTNAYRMNDEWLYKGFGQNDLTASSAGDALWVAGKVTDPAQAREYFNYAANQMAWIFGRNPFGESWLASSRVREYTRVPHWRLSAKHPVEGVVVPGAADRDGNKIPDYADTSDWYYSEPSINQQAMFIRVMTKLFFASGGDGAPVYGHWEGSNTDAFTATADADGKMTAYSNAAES